MDQAIRLLAVAAGMTGYLASSAKLTKLAIERDRKKTAAMLSPLSVDWSFFWEETRAEPWLTAGEVTSLGLLSWGLLSWYTPSGMKTDRGRKMRGGALLAGLFFWSQHLRSWAQASGARS